jgi:hypothetical protein
MKVMPKILDRFIEAQPVEKPLKKIYTFYQKYLPYESYQLLRSYLYRRTWDNFIMYLYFQVYRCGVLLMDVLDKVLPTFGEMNTP